MTLLLPKETLIVKIIKSFPGKMNHTILFPEEHKPFNLPDVNREHSL